MGRSCTPAIPVLEIPNKKAATEFLFCGGLRVGYGGRAILPPIELRALEDARCGELAGQPFGNLSEGQRGRVRLARALVSNPNVLVLDEPTSALDSVTEPAIFDTLEKLRRARGVTLLVVSHRTRVFAGRATHALFVDRGSGVAVAGEFNQVVTAPSFLSRQGAIPSQEPPSPDLSRSNG
jgi:ABC-type Mn2+/Zn2+ transport system ATPase subunit